MEATGREHDPELYGAYATLGWKKKEQVPKSSGCQGLIVVLWAASDADYRAKKAVVRRSFGLATLVNWPFWRPT